MPKITVEIKWDQPDDPFWLGANDVASALRHIAKNTMFVVRTIEPSDKVELGDDEILVFITK